MKTRYFSQRELSFSALEQGSGTPVILLHGFPDHARTFRCQIPVLAAAGYHALAPMMRGYEHSSQSVTGDYQLASIASDILTLIDDLDEGPVHLIGHDWGAVVSYLLAVMAPEKLLSLTTLAIPHPGRLRNELLRKRPSQLLKSWYMLFFQFRGLADYILERNDWRFIESLWRKWSPEWQLPEDERLALKATFQQPGVKKAALAYYRSLPRLYGSEKGRRTRQLFDSQITVPTLAMTGARDGCMDTRLHDDLMLETDFPAGLTVKRIEAAGHFLHLEKVDEVNQQILQHLSCYKLPRANPSRPASSPAILNVSTALA